MMVRSRAEGRLYVSAYGRLFRLASPSKSNSADRGRLGIYDFSRSFPSMCTSYIISVSQVVQFLNCIETRTLLLTRNKAELPAALRTPRGLQLNLYLNGTCGTSGAGSPPQKEVNETMSFCCFCKLEMSETAEQWSMPGSRPISFRKRTSLSKALFSALVRIDQHFGNHGRTDDEGRPSQEICTML